MSTYEDLYNTLRERVDSRLATVIVRDKPETIYEPCRYVLTGGGKRIRPVLVMLADRGKLTAGTQLNESLENRFYQWYRAGYLVLE